MTNDEFTCYVRVCGTKQEIGRESDRFLQYLKSINYKGPITTRFLPGDFVFDLGFGYEYHFIDITAYRTWCLGRTYRFLSPEGIDSIYQSGHPRIEVTENG